MMKMFAWRATSIAVPSKGILSNRISVFDAKCDIYGHFQESDVHAIFESPSLGPLWEASLFASFVRGHKFKSVIDAIDEFNRVHKSAAEDFIATM